MKDNEHEKTCEKALPELKELLQELSVLAQDQVKGVDCQLDDNYGQMLLVFVSKLTDHGVSIAMLLPGRDTLLLARSMFEGIALLLWAAEKKEDRASAWKEYVFVEDWKLVSKKQAAGTVIPQATINEKEEKVRAYGDRFLNTKGKRARRRGEKLTFRHYHNSWPCGTTIREICESTSARIMYSAYYHLFSDYHHWGSTILRALDRSGANVNYSPISWSLSTAACDAAFRSLQQACVMLAVHFNQDSVAGDLEKLAKRFNDWGDGLVADHSEHPPPH